MKKILSCLLFVFLLVGFSFAETAEDIMKSVRGKADINNVAADTDVNVQQNGRTIEVIKLRQYSSKDKNGLQRTLILFAGPAKYKNTRFLMRERSNGTMDQRVYLPSLGKARRIAAESEGNGSFFGTDFSYNDMAFIDRDAALDDYTMLPDEVYNGVNCFVIEAVSKDKKYAYSKTICKVDKETRNLLTAEFFDKNGKKIKQIELFDYKKISGIMTPMNVRMSTLATNTSTVISINKIQYGLDLPEKLFSTQYLETGR